MNQADTAWMLVSTALVLLMTPAMAFFYGGLVRSKNSAQHDDDELHLPGVHRAAMAVVGYSLAFSAATTTSATFRALRSGCRPRGAGHDPALPLHGLSGHLLHHHGGADFRRNVERMRFSAYLAFIILWALPSTLPSRTGCGVAAAR